MSVDDPYKEPLERIALQAYEIALALRTAQREQTAATILAALIGLMPVGQTQKWSELAEAAVSAADALHAELAKGGRP